MSRLDFVIRRWAGALTAEVITVHGDRAQRKITESSQVVLGRQPIR
jgi:hypothetical protein